MAARSPTLRLAAMDLRLVASDPLLAPMPFVPLLAAIALRLALPPVSGLLERSIGFSLEGYGWLARIVVVLFAGMFMGMVSGFLLLDDRDEGVSTYWGAMPPGRGGYLIARLGLFTALAFIVGAAAGFVFGGTLQGGLPGVGQAGGAGLGFARGAALPVLAAAAVGAFQAPIFALFLAANAADKVEGLAILKALGGLDLAPLAVLLPMPVRAVAWLFPQYWAAELALGRVAWPAALALALAASAAWIAPLAAKYRRRVD